MKKFLFFILIFFVCSLNINGLCYDSSLNEWALNTKIKFIDFNRNLINEETGEPLYKTMDYSYILTVDNSRDDIIIKASTSYGAEIEGIYVPGNDKSVCKNELLKTITYEIEPFNFYYKTEECEMYPEASLCTMYKDTSDVTEKEFKEEMKAYAESLNSDVDDPSWFEIIISYFLNYGIYILLPIVVLSIFYLKKIHVVKKNERKK